MKLSTDRKRIKKHKQERDVSKLYEQANSRIDLLEDELKAAKRIIVPTKDFRIVPYTSKNESEAVACVLLSDWHVCEVVEKSSVNGLNAYNPTIAKLRATECFQRIVKLIRKEQQDVKIGTLLLWLGGDFISGNIHDELLESCAMPPVEEARFAKQLLSSGLTYLREQLGEMKIICVTSVGNHSRITRKIHIATETGNSLETFIYTSLRDEHPDMTWIIDPSYNTYVSVYNKVLRFNHGTWVTYHGGIGGLTIPLLKALNGWDNQKRADMTFIGHYHTWFIHRRFIVNGSLIGMNAYSVSLKCEYEPPCQAFFLVDKQRGRTVNIPILFSK